MSIARHHNEWLSLIEISGPFLSLPVLLRTFPQGLEAVDRDGLTELRLAYDEWLDDQSSLKPSPAIHSVWLRYVLEHVLGFEKAALLEGQAIPTTLNTFVAEQGETLRPDLAVISSGSASQKPRLLVQLVPVTQGLEKSMQNHRWKASPAMRMLELLRATGVQLGLVTNGEQWMLVNAPKGETSAFVSWYAALWLEEPLTLRAFTSLLGSARFFSVAEEDTLEGMLKESVNEQQEVTDQLGYQVRRAVEVLIRAIDKADQDRGRALLKDIRESDLYEAALTVMMRLVFLFSAEERGLLLLGDPLYDQNYAVSTLRTQLRETADQQGEEVLERRFDAWCRLLATFRAVHDGIHHDRLNLPAYGGSLFDPDRYPFLEGRTSPPAPLPYGHGVPEGEGSSTADVLPISNRTVLHLLEALQILRVKVPGGGPAEPRRLSFRSLDVEQIGHVYEGLLDHIAVRAKDPVLGLIGSREKEPEISLASLQAEAAKGEKSFLEYLKEQTGRTENALRKALLEKPDVFAVQQLQIACNNDAAMYERVAAYAGMLRQDDFGYPAVFLPGSVYVTAGATRRATGTHYTPRSLTEPIVQHTLEPLVYSGPAEGSPKEEWKLKSPAELLELKVCDMAMGSAGFLVQVVRYLSERLLEAWDNLTLDLTPDLTPDPSPKQRGAIRITPEGQPATGKPGELIIPQDDEERLVLARRLVADRCIYGVDKNPLAVEIAKLSIWLTTMDKGRPFTFLDHALKCGDSLVGADEDMYRKWAFSMKGAQFTLYVTQLEEMIQTARQKRKELESFTVLDVRDAEHKAQLLKEADDAMARVKLGCDLLVGVRLLGLKKDEQETMLAHLLWDYVAGEPMEKPDAQRALHAAHKERAFHWPFEFPEVFATEGSGGFSAIVGNPPFVAGLRIST
ncbi:MAG TPA: type IIL restriction-modification enzyme MmeI, partial [Bellilinea sp.]|nr:type IIL restriction-modification enzyme MmeI [Bellilinea sp.]